VIRLNGLNELNVLNLLPYPRSLKRERGSYVLPKRAVLQLGAELP